MTGLREAWEEYRRSPVAVIALLVVLLIVAAAILAPVLSPQDPYDQAALDLMDARLEPGSEGSSGTIHILGTDNAGRDLLSAILYGLRTSLVIAITAGMTALLVGITIGLSAAYYGGTLGAVLMRIVDLQLSMPAILLALVIVAMLGQGIPQLVAALVIAQYAYFARTAYGAATAERRRDYVEAALSTPLSGARVLWRHLLPNTLPPLIVVATVQVATAISLEATLSFLGLGLPVTRPSLGLLIANGFQFLLSGRYWISVYPGLALMVTVLAINLVGDRLRHVLNPKRRR
ncbi:ABC transporter permease [Roseomonas sp. CCTCC AB2023176]|uniref:ABC transporter permease n=1 Tax=Roseomonas sp. CCTCC AB2023176 TaxID=3342640 RepID=UPI0035E1F25F